QAEPGRRRARALVQHGGRTVGGRVVVMARGERGRRRGGGRPRAAHVRGGAALGRPRARLRGRRRIRLATRPDPSRIGVGPRPQAPAVDSTGTRYTSVGGGWGESGPPLAA